MNINLSKLNKKLICVTIGDIEGIGIHLLLKEFKNKKIKDFILLTNVNIFIKYIKFSRNKINIINEINYDNYNKKKLNIYNYKTKNKETNTIDSLKYAYEITKKKEFIGILTLPLNKYKIRKSVSKKFIDQTTYFSKKENQKFSNMIFYYKNKFFIPLTIHIELKKVHVSFKNKVSMINKIENLHSTLINDFKIRKPKLIIAGINPHAGENETISKDDNKYLLPIINELKKKRNIYSWPNFWRWNH
jgi:4-hydroxythreonine-4-phosphate dehydrogenase